MALSGFSAPVSATTPAAVVTLAPDDVVHAHRMDGASLPAFSAFSSPATATTLTGAVSLLPDDVLHAHTLDGGSPGSTLTGFGAGGFGSGGFGGVSAAGSLLLLTIVSAPPPPPPSVDVDPTAPDASPARWSFSIGSWRTGPAAPLSGARNRQVTWRLVGRSEASFDLSGSDEAAGFLDELITDLWVTRSPVPDRATCLFRGRVGRTQHAIDANTHTVSVTVGDYRAVLDRRQLWEGGQLSWVNVDQAAIAFGLVQHAQAQPGGSLSITQGVGPVSGVTRARNDYPAGKPVGEALDQLSQVDNGFDWDITPDPDPRVPGQKLDIFHPARGTDRHQVLALGDRLVSINRTVDPGTYANAIRGTGADSTSSGGALAPVRREASDIATRPEGRWDGSMSDTDLTVQQTIVDRTVQELANRQDVTPQWTVTLKPNSWGGPDDIWLGDPVSLRVKSGPLDVFATYRVLEIPCSWDDDDNVTTGLTLGTATGINPRFSPRKVDTRLQALERR